jgi:hypothetical protein
MNFKHVNFIYIKPVRVASWEWAAGEPQPETGQRAVHKAVS